MPSLSQRGAAFDPEGSLPPSRLDFHPGDDYFTHPGEPFGEAALGLAIGPLGMRLEGLSGSQAAALRERFRPFVTDLPAAYVTIALRNAGVEGFLRLASAGGGPEVYRLESRASGRRLVLWSYEFAGWLDAGAGKALLALARPEGPLFDRGLENFLRVLTASFILEQGGFLLHASGVVRRGKAYVFFGPSGSGKTTVTHFSPGDTVLSDDLTLIVKRGEGTYEAAGIPFGLAHHRTPETSGSFPIASLNRLVQSPVVRREPLGRARALGEIAASLPFVMQETRQAARAIEIVGRALDGIPAHRLHFRKDDAFWGVVEEA